MASNVEILANGIKDTILDDAKSATKPHPVFCAAPADGHTNPIIRVAGEMIKRGYPVTFIAGVQFEDQIKALGAKVVSIPPLLNPKTIAERNAIPVGIPRLIYDLNTIFIGQTASRWEKLKSTLEAARERDPTREVLIMTETCFMGANPLSLGVPLPKGFTTRPKVVNLHVVPYLATSIDTAPFNPGLPPDSTESGRARNQLLNQMMVAGPFAQPLSLQEQILKDLGATEVLPREVPFHHWMLIHDLTLHLCPPSLEYPRSDMPSHVKFAGCLPPTPVSPDFVYTEWWHEVTSGDRKVVTVTQGTIATIYTDLLVPTMHALADRPDLLVVAILPPSDVALPANARVIDYLPYDAILSYTSAFAMNAGYGGFLHGVVNGVPMVLAGETEDKPEIAMRGEWSGVAVNLRTGTPSQEAVGNAVDKMLTDGRFKTRVEEVRRENEAMGVFDVVEREMLGVLE